MQKQTDIGIIGKGFVGNAIFQGLNHYYNVKTYDVDPKKSSHTFDDVINTSGLSNVQLPLSLSVIKY